MYDNEHIYTVSQLCRESRLLLETTFLTLTIEGEISNLASPSSGHIYFTLKDDNAQVQCAMFSPQLRKVSFKPKDGGHVILKARVSLYEARGNFQLNVKQMDAAGEGVLRQQFEALKNRLLNEGLFDEVAKNPLPELAKKVGVITSSSGAVIHDILTVLNNRFPLLPVLVYPVTVQGDYSKRDIVDAIELANKRCDCDVLILARGGGSLEDLWAFNEETVAHAIYQSAIPIISAIGHEVDFTIADFVADYRAPTPSAAAEAISPDQYQWISRLNLLADQMAEMLSLNIDNKQHRLENLQHRLKRTHPGAQLQMQAQRLDDSIVQLTKRSQNALQMNKLRLSGIKSRLMSNNPRQIIINFQQRFAALKQRLSSPIKNQLQQSRVRFVRYHTGLETLSPLATLSRGYSITKREADGAIISSIKQLSLNDLLRIQLSDGSLIATLEGIREEN